MRAAPFFLALLLVSMRVDTAAAELGIEEVFSSLEMHHPRVAQALASEESARADLFSARGGFDPYLRIYGAIREGGYYALRQLDVEVRQPTPFWGTEVWAGYRIGVGEDGSYPSYYSNETLDGGEIRAGIRVPLWRDGPFDSRRARRRSAEIGIERAEATRERVTLELRQKAVDAYMAWVAAGRKVAVYTELRDLARTRQEWLRSRVEAGLVPEITMLDAERAVLSRERSLIGAERTLRAYALVLSLFVRDPEGEPAAPSPADLPAELARPPVLGPVGEIAACHPRIRQAEASLARAGVAVELARAQRAPQIDVRAQVSRDFGQGDSSLPGTVFEGGLQVSMPLGLRTARGALESANASQRAAEEALRLAGDQLRAETQEAAVSYEAAARNLEIAERLAANARALAEAERTRFEAGSSTLFVVNQREQAIASAELARVDASRDLWSAYARWIQLTSCEV